MRIITDYSCGIHPHYAKELSQHCVLEQALAPEVVYIPLVQHLGAACKPLVGVGQKVLKGTKVGQAPDQAGFSSPVHSSVSGTVKGIERFYHPLLGTVDTVIIENDKTDCAQPPLGETLDPHNATGEQIITRIKEAGIVGMGGAGFPTYVKMMPPKKICHIDTLIINGAECEPYLTGDYRLMIEKTEVVFQGIIALKKCLGVAKVFIGIENNKPEALVKMQDISRQDPDIEVVSLPCVYPQGAEKTIIKMIVGREVPSKKLPFDAGVVVQNVGTCYAVAQALKQGNPLYERVVTISGSGIMNPKNLVARIGTPLGFLIEQCGGMKGVVSKIICGGPMMGVTQYTLDIPVIKTMSGVILLQEHQARPEKIRPCIRCGRCIRACPMQLMPCMITNAAEKKLWAVSEQYHIVDCVECGCCAYVCPAKRPLVHLVKYAKRWLRMKYART